MMIRPNWLFKYGLWWPSELAAKWQEQADAWKALGEWPRARWCQEHADYWARPFLAQVYGEKPTRTPPPLRRAVEEPTSERCGT